MNSSTSTKKQQMQSLLDELSSLPERIHIQGRRKGVIQDLSLINQFALHKDLANLWFDWVPKADAPIMIIGQDWGPYSVLKRFIASHTPNRSTRDEYMREVFSSRTEKFIFKTLKESYQQEYGKDMPADIWDSIIFTVAVFFTRQGKHFRGSNNFCERQSYNITLPYLSKQIDIVQPKIILPLGNLALSSLNDFYILDLPEVKVSKVLKDLEGKGGYFKTRDTYIIPAYHPAAHIGPDIQMRSWHTMMKLLKQLQSKD